LNDPAVPGSIWREPALRTYLGASSAARFAFSMQTLLVSWLLIGVLHTSADLVGLSQAIVGIPGLLLMLWGGASADRTDPRTLLIRTYAVASLVPLVLITFDVTGQLHYWTVTLWALLMSVVSSFSSPADSAILNRAARSRVQEAVTAATAAGFVVQVMALALAGQSGTIGLATVLVAQAATLAAGAALFARLPPQSTLASRRSSAARAIAEGFGVAARDPLLRSVLGLNFLSMLFNAGTFTLVLPFMVTKLYGGDAAFFAWTLVVFFSGAAMTNFVMLRFTPLRHPGKLFLAMQVTRALLLFVLWFEPPIWLLVITLVLWGFNMGITTTTSRAMIQESASDTHRGRVLSLHNVGFLGAQPLGAMMLGVVVANFGILGGLWPGIIASAALFVLGVLATPIWHFRSVEEG
jgi:predicted MFS family arabinose efflux permease